MAGGRQPTITKESEAVARDAATGRPIARHVLELCVWPLRLVSVNPIPASAIPKKRKGPAQQFVYPDEDALLMRDTRADLGHRVLFGFLHRQGVRRAEALGGAIDEVDDALEDDDALGDVPPLTWGRVDLRRGCILPGRNKTGDTSLTPIEPDLVRALTAWKALAPRTGAGDSVFVTLAGEAIDPRDAKEIYTTSVRAALAAADCDRPELWASGGGRRPLRLHDARASFVTVALINGRPEDWVRRRSKHKSSAIERYRRELGTFRELTLGDWTPLDVAIPELAAASAAANVGSPVQSERLRETETPETEKGSEACTFRTSVGARGFEPPTPRPPV